MAIFNFFKVPKHQRYNYIPRYWDPQKEEMEARLRELRDLEDKSGDVEAMKARISGGFKRNSRIGNSYRRKQVRRSNMILVGAIVGLLILTYFVLVRYLPEISSALE